MVFMLCIVVLMKSNKSMTLYHKHYNPKTKVDEWHRYPIENVMWQGGEGASINKGYDKANDVSIWIFYDENEDLETIPFEIGDFVVEGIIEDEITMQSDIKVDTYNIITYVNNNYGSYNMQHVFLGVK